jgi:hypothetical protein
MSFMRIIKFLYIVGKITKLNEERHRFFEQLGIGKSITKILIKRRL